MAIKNLQLKLLDEKIKRSEDVIKYNHQGDEQIEKMEIKDVTMIDMTANGVSIDYSYNAYVGHHTNLNISKNNGNKEIKQERRHSPNPNFLDESRPFNFGDRGETPFTHKDIKVLSTKQSLTNTCKKEIIN